MCLESTQLLSERSDVRMIWYVTRALVLRLVLIVRTTRRHMAMLMAEKAKATIRNNNVHGTPQ